MSTTLTIRNLEEPVKHLLRIQAANHKRSMEAEARDILTPLAKEVTANEATAKWAERRRAQRLGLSSRTR